MNRPDPGGLLEECRSIAVVGWSDNPERPSHWIAAYFEEQGYEVFRVNPLHADGERVWSSLEDLPGTVDLIDVFRTPAAVPELVEPAARAGARVFWMQPGAESGEAARLAEESGMTVVIGPCAYAEHRARP